MSAASEPGRTRSQPETVRRGGRATQRGSGGVGPREVLESAARMQRLVCVKRAKACPSPGQVSACYQWGQSKWNGSAKPGAPCAGMAASDGQQWKVSAGSHGCVLPDMRAGTAQVLGRGA